MTPAAQIYSATIEAVAIHFGITVDLVDEIVKAAAAQNPLDAGAQQVYDVYTEMINAPSTLRPSWPDHLTRYYDKNWKGKAPKGSKKIWAEIRKDLAQ